MQTGVNLNRILTPPTFGFFCRIQQSSTAASTPELHRWCKRLWIQNFRADHQVLVWHVPDEAAAHRPVHVRPKNHNHTCCCIDTLWNEFCSIIIANKEHALFFAWKNRNLKEVKKSQKKKTFLRVTVVFSECIFLIIFLKVLFHSSIIPLFLVEFYELLLFQLAFFTPANSGAGFLWSE